MATSRSWRAPMPIVGPFRASADDIGELNQVFSDAFTERYRRDGMVGVRVPFLNPAVWRYAIDDADAGALLWRDERGHIAAFNMIHRSGVEGWMGPLAVRTEFQGAGSGKDIVMRGVDWLQSQGARVIGLETMPRTLDNIGFYSRLGFQPGRLTLTTTLDASAAADPVELLGRHSSVEREALLEETRALLDGMLPGYDFSRELQLTDSLSLGDTLLLRERPGGPVVGFALCHTAPLVEGRSREELRVLKLVLARASLLDAMLRALRDFARRSGTRRVAIRIQGDYDWAYRHAMSLGARVRWSDLRMTWNGRDEPRPADGLVLSNWEI